ncbi:CS1 type fimbrial major subunit [Escherichia coli]|uniref:CS1 type fimbrial major subunit n=1 Tax=Escherichia coli TaxID=562 RepID=UPI000C1C48CD|nr:CS1 type fimbrial major subunit [Escherichia coli]
MKKVFAKSLLVAAMFSVAGSALAVQKDITVTANVDAALDMTQTDNTALPKAVEMQYLPGQGLQSYQLMTKIFASDALTNGSLAKNLMFAQITKGVLETGIYRGVVSIYLSQDI